MLLISSSQSNISTIIILLLFFDFLIYSIFFVKSHLIKIIKEVIGEIKGEKSANESYNRKLIKTILKEETMDHPFLGPNYYAGEEFFKLPKEFLKEKKDQNDPVLSFIHDYALKVKRMKYLPNSAVLEHKSNVI